MTPDQLKSQIYGLSLALMTAIGCIAYERIVKSCSYFTVGLLAAIAYIPFFLCALFFQSPIGDIQNVWKHKWWVLIYILSGVTGPLWYLITKKQSVAVGAIYEVKYIVMLAVIYWIFGTTPLTWNTVVGICLAVFSVYFISLK